MWYIIMSCFETLVSPIFFTYPIGLRAPGRTPEHTWTDIDITAGQGRPSAMDASTTTICCSASSTRTTTCPVPAMPIRKLWSRSVMRSATNSSKAVGPAAIPARPSNWKANADSTCCSTPKRRWTRRRNANGSSTKRSPSSTRRWRNMSAISPAKDSSPPPRSVSSSTGSPTRPATRRRRSQYARSPGASTSTSVARPRHPTPSNRSSRRNPILPRL